MAGSSLGASAPALPALPSQPIRSPGHSRARRHHGACQVGRELAHVFSSRRQAETLPVQLVIDHAQQPRTARMSALQAQALAAALIEAATAAEEAMQGGAQ